MEWTDIGQKSKLECWLNKNQIKYYYGKHGKVITTIEAVNATLTGNQPSERIRFE